jgi:hypothetical protein
MDWDKSVLKGVIDIHVHTGPEAHKKRKFNEYELAEEAEKYGATGIVIKTHAFETASRAKLVQRSFSNVHIWGGIALNEEVGGLNPFAVEAAADLGGKVVWLPTLSSKHEREAAGKTGGIVCVENGRTLPALDAVLRIIAEHDMVLATGHLAWEEQMVVVERAKELGVNRILINHPTLFRISMPLEAQRRLLRYGVFFERNYGGSKLPVSREFEKHFDRNLTDIRALGASTSIMATDLGQPGNCGWSDGFAEYIHYMLDHGVSQDEIRQMTRDNPRKLLGVSENE